MLKRFVSLSQVRALREASETLLFNKEHPQHEAAKVVAHTCDFLLGEEGEPPISMKKPVAKSKPKTTKKPKK